MRVCGSGDCGGTYLAAIKVNKLFVGEFFGIPIDSTIPICSGVDSIRKISISIVLGGALLIAWLLAKYFSRRATGFEKKWKIRKWWVLLFLLLNIPPAAVPVFTYVQWLSMCESQEDYVVHGSFDTPAEFLDNKGIPVFASRYGSGFKLPMEGLDLELVDESKSISRIVYVERQVVKKQSSGDLIVETNSAYYHPSKYPKISLIYNKLKGSRCGYSSHARTQKEYINILKEAFTNKDISK